MKEYARRFPTDTAMEVYTPKNAPPTPDLSGLFKLDQTVPQTMIGVLDGAIVLENSVIKTKVVPQFTYFT